MHNWTPTSWRDHPIQQQPIYTNAEDLMETLAELKTKSGLVSIQAIDWLLHEMQEVQRGERFLLQGGDCAESFANLSPEHAQAYVAMMEDMAEIIEYELAVPVTVVGRIAGQWAKPRTQQLEVKGAVTLPSYRGDMINSVVFEESARRADPKRLLMAYDYAEQTIRYINNAVRNNNIFCSHEGLLLSFEEALVRYDLTSKRFYASSAHMLWIGNRTVARNEAHVEFMRGIANPIALKIDANMNPETLLELLTALNPLRTVGKISCTVRHGANHIVSTLPPLIKAVQKSGHPVIWLSDPMHGNTNMLPDGRKIRHMEMILREFRLFTQILRSFYVPVGGVNLELTPLDVTEFLGGRTMVKVQDLQRCYDTYCDPRLNFNQSIEMAHYIAEVMRG